MAERKDSVCIRMTMIVPFVVMLITGHLAFGAPNENCQRGQYQSRDNARHFDCTDGFIDFLHFTLMLAYNRLFSTRLSD